MSYETREEPSEVETILIPDELGIGGTMESHDEALSITQDQQRLADAYQSPQNSLVSIVMAGPRLGYRIVLTGTSLATTAALLPLRVALFPLIVARDLTNQVLEIVLPSISNTTPASTPRRLSDPCTTSIDPGTPLPSSKAASIKSETREDKGIVMNVVETSLGIGASFFPSIPTSMYCRETRIDRDREPAIDIVPLRIGLSLHRSRRSRICMDSTVSREGYSRGVAPREGGRAVVVSVSLLICLVLIRDCKCVPPHSTSRREGHKNTELGPKMKCSLLACFPTLSDASSTVAEQDGPVR